MIVIRCSGIDLCKADNLSSPSLFYTHSVMAAHSLRGTLIAIRGIRMSCHGGLNTGIIAALHDSLLYFYM